jgi:hypothetical protein
MAGYYWEYLTEERNCELAALIGIFFYIDFFTFVFISFLGSGCNAGIFGYKIVA